ncbi:Retinoblastoma-related protein [Camellia lanceoleosa]|uniref:Retinoblastoma-related protein n=1 Tax=Camellia lanceoleosa TaxID=1840588 RepID=A0ACC0IX30_9ERIC|nr:Retinoblastoma-related protein [Camellia lanceoleosa]
MHKFFVTFVFPSIDGLIYFKDLLEDTSLSSSLNILENDYADATRNKSELDERVFVNKEDSLLGSGSSSGGAMNISGAKALKWEQDGSRSVVPEFDGRRHYRVDLALVCISLHCSAMAFSGSGMALKLALVSWVNLSFGVLHCGYRSGS